MAKAKYSYNSKRKEWITLVWDGTYNENGTKHRKRIASKKSSADLERKVQEFKQSVESKKYYDFTDLSFYEYAQKWVITAKSSREKNTQTMYANIVKKFESLANVRVDRIRHSHFQALINENITHARTCLMLELAFRQIIKAAIKDHILPKGSFEEICEDIELPKYHKPQKRALTNTEKEAIAEADLNEKERAFITILFYFGVRRGEALALTPFDFNWDKKELSINKAMIFIGNQPEIKLHPKSDNGIRKLPIPDKALKIIKPFVDKEKGPYIFHGTNSKMMTKCNYDWMWNSIIKKINATEAAKFKNLHFTAHIFRHNYCTMLCYQIPAISTKMIARLLGDTEKVVLDTYSHIIEEKENVTETVNTALVM